MKKILQLICLASMLCSTGCVFWHGHDREDERQSPMNHDERSGGENHWEDSGNSNHDANR
jgi:hypothetical protein